MVTGIVLAGRRNHGALAAGAPTVPWEALIPIAGRPMAVHVIAALAEVCAEGGVFVAGPADLAGSGAVVVPPGERVTVSLRAALDAAGLPPGAPRDLVIATGDAPLLTAAAIRHLLEQARHRHLALAYPIVRRADCEAQFPGVRRTYVRFRDGTFTGGNCFYLRGDLVSRALALLEGFYADRKRPLRLAGLLGWRLLVGLWLGTARLADAEAAASRLLGQAVGAVVADDPRIAFDVDRPEDLAVVRAVLEQR